MVPGDVIRTPDKWLGQQPAMLIIRTDQFRTMTLGRMQGTIWPVTKPGTDHTSG